MVAANDDIANAVIGVLKGSGLNGHVVVTGQDAGVNGLQNIITGQQSMTIFKNVSLEADAATKLAVALIADKDPAAAGLTWRRSRTRSRPATSCRRCCCRPRSSHRPTSRTSSTPVR